MPTSHNRILKLLVLRNTDLNLGPREVIEWRKEFLPIIYTLKIHHQISIPIFMLVSSIATSIKVHQNKKSPHAVFVHLAEELGFNALQMCRECLRPTAHVPSQRFSPLALRKTRSIQALLASVTPEDWIEKVSQHRRPWLFKT